MTDQAAIMAEIGARDKLPCRFAWRSRGHHPDLCSLLMTTRNFGTRAKLPFLLSHSAQSHLCPLSSSDLRNSLGIPSLPKPLFT